MTSSPRPGSAATPKLVFVNRYFHPDESATSRMLSDLTFRLAQRGVPVAVVTSRQLFDDPQAALPPQEIINDVSIHRVSTANRGRARLAGRALDYASFHAAAGMKLLRLLARDDVVVAKTDPPLISIVTSHAARLRGAVLVNWLQDVFPEVASALTPEVMPGWLEKRLLASRDHSLRRAAMNVVLSAGMRQRLLSRGIQDEHIRIVPNWADASSVTPRPAEDSETRRTHGLSGRFVIGYSGNLGRAHEFDTLLGTARLLREDPRFAFLITGSGAKAASLKRAASEAGLANILFQEFQPPERLADSLAAADVHLVSLLPALEGLIVPSKIYGILAAGRPAVFIGDVEGDLARMLRASDCGISVGIGDTHRLAAELRALCNDSGRVQTMGTNARALALARYTSEHAVEDWLSFLTVIAPSVVLCRQRTLAYAR